MELLLNTARSFIEKTCEIAWSDKLHLRLYGDETARAHYRHFTAPHRLIPFLGRKTLGAALVKLPDEFDNYLQGKSFSEARHKRRRALKEGFRFDRFQAVDRTPEILEINRSAHSRQGRPMPATYLDEKAVREFCNQAKNLDGVFDSEGQLKAYAFTPVLGDVFSFSRLLGHAAANRYGIMDLLITEAIRSKIIYRAEHGHPGWAMYDMYWGASPGLREFKRRLGFRPYRVKWSWSSDA